VHILSSLEALQQLKVCDLGAETRSLFPLREDEWKGPQFLDDEQRERAVTMLIKALTDFLSPDYLPGPTFEVVASPRHVAGQPCHDGPAARWPPARHGSWAARARAICWLLVAAPDRTDVLMLRRACPAARGRPRPPAAPRECQTIP
jgi:hypothetical protein